MLEYVGSVEKVEKAIEKTSGDPLHQHLDLKKDEEIFINDLMRLIWNSGPTLCRGPGLYCEGLSRKYTPNEIYKIAIKFCEEEISEEMARGLFEKIYDEFERVITNDLGYTYNKEIGKYEKQKPHKKNNRLSRFLNRK